MKTLVIFGGLGLLPTLAAAQIDSVGLARKPVAYPVPAGVIPLADLGKPMPEAVNLVVPEAYRSKPLPQISYTRDWADKVQSQLSQLKRMPLNHKYVNYEVIKVMPGVGWGASRPFGGLVTTTAEQPVEQDSRFSGRFQFLWPRPLFRNAFPLALGLTYASSVVAVRQASFALGSDPTVGELREAPSVRFSRLRTQGLGFVALRVIRMPGVLHSFTMLAGASGEYNLSTHLHTHLVNGSDMISRSRSLRPYLNRWSVPVQVQVGWSPSQFFSVGGYATYDVVPRFNAAALRKVHQMTAGLSLGFII